MDFLTLVALSKASQQSGSEYATETTKGTVRIWTEVVDNETTLNIATEDENES